MSTDHTGMAGSGVAMEDGSVCGLRRTAPMARRRGVQIGRPSRAQQPRLPVCCCVPDRVLLEHTTRCAARLHPVRRDRGGWVLLPTELHKGRGSY